MERVSASLQDVQKKIDTITLLTSYIATPRDSHDVRQQLFELRHQCIEILKECDRIITSSINTPQQGILSVELRKVFKQQQKKPQNILIFLSFLKFFCVFLDYR